MGVRDEDRSVLPAESGEADEQVVVGRRTISRRDFLKACAVLTAALALPATSVNQVAAALEGPKRLSTVWLNFQECTGCTESFLRASRPSVAEIVLDKLSIDYHETIMAAAGHQAEEALKEATGKEGYLLVVEGAIPTAEDGLYCCIGGRTASSILEESAEKAAAVIAIGNCAAFGGLPAANPNPTNARSVSQMVPRSKVINLAGCPPNAANITATIVHFLTFGTLPDTDSMGRPLFAHGKRIHDNCERRAHFDAGQFVQKWGDDGHRQGWCLYEMGCKGPQAYHNCPSVRWNDGTSWPVGAGHPCVACAAPSFWDRMSPFYKRLPEVPTLPVEATVDTIGLGVMGVVAAGVAVHAVGSAIRHKTDPKSE